MKAIAPYKQFLKDFMLVSAGVLVLAAGLKFFLVPNHIAPGGFSGIATLLNFMFGLPVGTVVLALNLPLMLISFRRLGIAFMAKCVYGTVLLTVLLDFLPISATATNEGFLACTYGGAISGLGVGIIFLGNGSSGGTDLLAQLMHSRWPHLKTGWILLVLDGAVVLAAAVVTGLTYALYSLIALFIMSKLITFVTEGLRRAKAFLIITGNPERIGARINKEMVRGVTKLGATGFYSGTASAVLLCVVESTAEVARLKGIIREEDAGAFVVAMDTREVLGEGFSQKDAP